ncbi:hypothetical protein [Vibrio splendidus]|uniref:hypothetical protein n=1 Tax=Vibrio splendidus TaxID=29497 RepID=UPI001F533835|nr:hypothetical protein [Vibrio splendidus]
MNTQKVFEELETASDFELFRLKSAIEKVLEDPDRARALKAKITVGMEVEYFCTERNNSVLCTILKVVELGWTLVKKKQEKVGHYPFIF